ncbi:hypothetical protein Q4534_01475 [Cyclobacterium sp. 1_MG-2023]|uniref:hypothetical protein n=1 Tax=Cyclobacterium sp. 1_MG-2023 TaxID=3062681 RepID=UPI0026E4235A|nr:hypothetical protein [Cyclobacterium sp. 1_MG-2023]MDO6436051.1 hypothetical protein [Cyclobacterium sp. 1_MG-2023]|eukprot:TRINITY_DN70635_c0_g1_i1.p1 TRINITY_DN70635_c0_g1~~TRINITY_DN70635_c0_g1_i1.p1  ORF type:complete len:117 (-),score=4.43 TRINITY_DN70635_c0_g1_i1:121-471(-)
MDKNYTNIDFTKIEDMVEDDLDFRNQLLDAIEIAVEELETTYLKGIEDKDSNSIKLARHKIKPTLGLFGLQRLSHILSEGKKLMEEGNFNSCLDAHKEEFKTATNAVIADVKDYRD